MEKIQPWEIVGGVIIIALPAIAPLMFLAGLLIIIAGFSAFGWRIKQHPLKGLYLGLEIGAMTSAALSAIAVAFLIITNEDPMGLLLVLPLSSLILIIGAVVGMIIGIKKK